MYNLAFAVTPSDTIRFELTDAIYVGVAGLVVAVLEHGGTVTIEATSGLLLPIRIIGVNATGTTASSIVRLYRR